MAMPTDAGVGASGWARWGADRHNRLHRGLHAHACLGRWRSANRGSMWPLLLHGAAALLLASAAGAATPLACSFPRNLTGLQCQDMGGNPAASEEGCRLACCALLDCTVWNFAPGHAAQSCWLWSGPTSPGPTCEPPTGTWKRWAGGSTARRPPPPAPPTPAPSPSPPSPPPPPITVNLSTRGPALGGVGVAVGKTVRHSGC